MKRNKREAGGGRTRYDIELPSHQLRDLQPIAGPAGPRSKAKAQSRGYVALIES